MLLGKELRLITIFSVIIAVASCHHDDPISSLKRNHFSETYNEAFWTQEEKANSALWQEGSQICHQPEYQSKPNCGSIHNIQLFSHPLKFPKYGSGEGFGPDSLRKL